MNIPSHTLDSARELRIRAEEQAKALRAETERATKAVKAWEEYEAFLMKRWPLHLRAWAERHGPMLKAMRADRHPGIPDIEEVYRSAREESEQTMRRYPSLLEAACNSSSIALDVESRHPIYTLENGFLKLEIDESKQMARLSNRERQLEQFPADVDAVVEAVKRHQKRIFGRPFQAERFLKMLRSQYTAILKKDKKADGEAVPIRQIASRLRKNSKGFNADEFLVDLSRLVEKGPLEIDGKRLDLQQTKDTEEGMLLHGAAGRGYVGFVLFKEQ
jgi:hypothetical protein